MTPAEISGSYELETGNVIAETCGTPDTIPAVLVANHGPFTWGKGVHSAVNNAIVLEELAFMAWHNLRMQADILPIRQELLDRHYLRKHGAGAYYGQK